MTAEFPHQPGQDPTQGVLSGELGNPYGVPESSQPPVWPGDNEATQDFAPVEASGAEAPAEAEEVDIFVAASRRAARIRAERAAKEAGVSPEDAEQAAADEAERQRQQHIEKVTDAGKKFYDWAKDNNLPSEEVGEDTRKLSAQARKDWEQHRRDEAVDKGKTGLGRLARGVAHSAGFGQDIEAPYYEAVPAKGWIIGARTEEVAIAEPAKPAEPPKEKSKQDEQPDAPETPVATQTAQWNLVVGEDGLLAERKAGVAGSNPNPSLDKYPMDNVMEHIADNMAKLPEDAS